MVAYLATRDCRNLFVQQVCQVPYEPRLGLPAFAEQDQVVASEDPSLQRGENRFFVSDDRGEDPLASFEPVDEVVPQLLLDGAIGKTRRSQLSQGRRAGAQRYLPRRSSSGFSAS